MLSSITKGVFFRLAYQVLLFFVGMLVAQLAGADQFGTLSLMVVNAAIFMIITGLGTDASLIWHLSGNELSESKSFSFAAATGFIQLSLFVLMETVVYNTTGTTLLAQQPGSNFLVIELMYFAGLVLTEKYTSLFYGHNKANIANKVLAGYTAMFLLLFLFAYLNQINLADPVMIFSAMTLGMGIILSIAFLFSIHNFRFTNLSKTELHSLFRFSGIVFVTNCIQFVAYRLDYWLVNYFNDNQQLGVYAQSNRFAQLLWVIPGILAGLIMPAIRKKDDPLDNLQFRGLLRTMNLLNILLTICLIGFAYASYTWFFQPEYFPGWKVLLLMIPGYFFFASTTLLAAWFSAKNLLLINLAGSIICFVLIGIADLLLIPKYSIDGAAIANTIGYSLTTLYFVYQYRKKGSHE